MEAKELKASLESYKDSKEWLDIVAYVKEWIKEKREALVEWKFEEWELDEDYTKADLFRHEIVFLEYLIEQLDSVKTEAIKEVFVEDLKNSIEIRKEILAWETNEVQLDCFVEWQWYLMPDLWRKECRWVKCFENLPNKHIDMLQLKVQQEEADEASKIQENLDALNVLEQNGDI